MIRYWNILQQFAAYPGFVLMRTVARFECLRSVIVFVVRKLRHPVGSYLVSLGRRRSQFFADVDPVAVAVNVERDGFAVGLSLSPRVVSELCTFAATNCCFANRDPRLGFLPARIEQARAIIGRRFLLAHYFNVRRQSPLIARLTKDPVLLEVAARYLGTAPKLVGVSLWWSYPEAADAGARSTAAQMFHYDLDDFKFIKFFFYLTDVDTTSGPHVIVRATHRHKQRVRLRDVLAVRRYTDQEVLAAYGQDRIATITGPAGTGFAEDTLCIHKGDPPTERERLLLQVQFALNDFGNQHDHIDDSKLATIA
jgi:hypothetical protein